ncbi:unnamed protein product, partial [marine sediment metagenome]
LLNFTIIASLMRIVKHYETWNSLLRATQEDREK